MVQRSKSPPVREAPSAEKYDTSYQPNEISWYCAFTTYFGYAVLVTFGHLRDFVGFWTGLSRYCENAGQPGYAPMFQSWENFYTRRMYHRIQDCWNRPVGSRPASSIDVMDRDSGDGMKTMRLTGKSTRCLNLGSYNYLGFADDWATTCRKDVVGSLDEFNVSTSSPRLDAGTTTVHKELEVSIAKYVGKESAIVYNMGYGTNTTCIPSLMGKGCLIISDTLNHTSIVNGSRASGAVIRVFAHNEMGDLDRVLRRAIVDGQPRTHRPWKKIMVMVEGIYSMEGEICDLAGVVAVAKKYKAYMYVDEAHSIGALGKTGRGICEHCGVDPDDIDVMMGTFTKSFGAMGGYIAASKGVIDHLKSRSGGALYGNAMSPVVCQQVLTALSVIAGTDGTDTGQRKLQAIKSNSNFFRQGLIDMGLEVFGDWDSPIMPVMLYNPAKIAAFSRECYKRKLAVVVVGFPATPLMTSRTRFCISAGHTRPELEDALVKIKEVAKILKIRYHSHMTG